MVLWKALYFKRQESPRILSPGYRLVMNLSVLIARRIIPRVRFLGRTTSFYRLVIGVVMVACFVMPPQICSVDDGNEDSAPVTAVVTSISPSRSSRECQEQTGRLSRMRTPRSWADNGVRKVEFNLGTQDGRLKLKAFCLLRC